MHYLFFALLLTTWAQADVLVRVRAHVVVPPQSEVKLAQLIDATSLSPTGVRALEAVALTRAPELGERQELARASYMEALRTIVEAERARGQKVHVVMPKTVIIDTVKREISEELVNQELIQAWQPLCNDCQLSIESLSLPRISDVRDWTLKVKAELPKGSFSIAVDLIKDNGSLAPAWISGRLVAKRKVPVARRVLNLNERVQPDDVAWEYRDTSMAYDGVPLAEELTGKKMKQAARAGDVLWRSWLEKEKAIHRGDQVQLRSHGGLWEVSVGVIAQQDAYIGDMVNLKNPKTGTSLMGEVVGQGEVELR